MVINDLQKYLGVGDPDWQNRTNLGNNYTGEISKRNKRVLELE